MPIVAPELVDSFRRDGFVRVPGLVDPGELERFGAVIDAAVRARTAADARKLEEKSPYEQSFLQCINLWEDAPAMRGLTFHPRICGSRRRV